MASANEELVRSACAEFNREGFAGLARFADPQIVFSELPQAPEHAVVSGLDGVLGWASRLEEVWEILHVEVVEMTEVDAERVIAVLRLRARARPSGIEVEQLSGSLFTIRAGRFVRWAVYPSREEALRAAGLAK